MAQREVICPSGAILKVTPSPFAEANELYKAVLAELKTVQIKDLDKLQVHDLYKDLFCLAFSSPLIEKKLWACFTRCTYNAGKGDFRIDASTFEAVESRQDYMTVCMEVGRENIDPFVKSLYALWSHAITTTENIPV